MAGFSGAMAIVLRTAVVMSKDAVPEVAPEAAVTVTEPILWDAAMPAVAGSLLMVAMVESEVLQWTLDVRFWVEESV